MCILSELSEEFGLVEVVIGKPTPQGTRLVKAWTRGCGTPNGAVALSGPLNENTTVTDALIEIRTELRNSHSLNLEKVATA